MTNVAEDIHSGRELVIMVRKAWHAYQHLVPLVKDDTSFPLQHDLAIQTDKKPIWVLYHMVWSTIV